MILSEWIDSIRHELDRPPNSVTLGWEELKGVLGEWFLAAQRLEAGAGDLDLAKDYKSLKEEFETLKTRQKKELHIRDANHEGELQRFHANRASELEQWESALSTSNAEVNRLRAEYAKPEETAESREMKERIMLTLINGAKLASHSIAYKVGKKYSVEITKDGAEVYLSDLVAAKMVRQHEPRTSEASGIQIPSPEYSLDIEGQRYLKERGAIK